MVNDETKNEILHTRYGMFSPDGDLRVGEAIIHELENGDPSEDLWDRVERITKQVASDGAWCAEARDTVVEESVAVILSRYNYL